MILFLRDKMQNPNHNSDEDKFAMNFGNFDSNNMFNAAHMGGFNIGMKRSAHDAGLDREMNLGPEEDVYIKKEGKVRASSSRDNSVNQQHTSLDQQELHQGQQKSTLLPNGKKTKGRVKIKMEFIDNKLRRYTTFSKRKTGIMKKAYELSTLTGTQVMLLVASETGHVYTFATRKLQPMITSEAGKALIQTCLNSPDPPQVSTSNHHLDQRMSATGYEETELSYAVNEEEHKSPGLSDDYMNGSSCSGSESSSPPTPCMSPAHTPNSLTNSSLLSSSNSNVVTSSGGPHGGLPLHMRSGLVLTPSSSGEAEIISGDPIYTISSINEELDVPVTLKSINEDAIVPTNITIRKATTLSGGTMVCGGSGLIYSPGSNVVYAPSQDGSAPLLFNLPPGLQITQEQGTGRKSQLMTLPISVASAVSAATNSAYLNSQNNQSLPTDLSLHIKRETDS